MAENGGGLTAKQARAIAALITQSSQQEAAEAAGVGLRTLERWLAEDSTFQAALLAAEVTLIDDATRRLLRLQATAIERIETLMTGATIPAAVQLRAAESLLDHALRWRELRNVETRLAALERLAGKEEKENED